MVSQVLTLYTTPVIYLYMDRVQARFRRRMHTHAIPGAIATAPGSLKDPSPS
jgi:hypothetical protein